MHLQRLTVIIPSYNRSSTLLQALGSLQAQTLPEFETLVVDNATDPKVERQVKGFNRTARCPARYVPEPQLGLHNARHAGTRAATGEILVFTDDDATFDPEWLQAYATAFVAHPEMVAAGGPVRPVWECSPPQWLLDYMGSSNCFPILSLMEPYQEFRLEPKGYFFGVNMAIRRDALIAVGGFNPESFGDIWIGDGESGLNWKLWERKMLVGYVPEALTYHHIPPSRMTVEYFCRRMANQGAADAYTELHHRMPSRYQMFRTLRWLVRTRCSMWLCAWKLRGRSDSKSLQIQMNSAKTQAEAKYMLRLFLSNHFRQLVMKENWLS